MVRNNYDLIPEIRCRECGWYESDDNWCCFFASYHNPGGFCDEGVSKCCRNCECSELIEGFQSTQHRCKEKNEIVDPMNVCDNWDRWTN